MGPKRGVSLYLGRWFESRLSENDQDRRGVDGVEFGKRAGKDLMYGMMPTQDKGNWRNYAVDLLHPIATWGLRKDIYVGADDLCCFRTSTKLEQIFSSLKIRY